MLDPATLRRFDIIYASDLVYSPGCWTLCGDANCCNFGRYKSQMKLLGRSHAQELPLLPGEFEYLQHKGWLGEFPGGEHRVVEYPLACGTMRLEFMVGTSSAGCACRHATRTTVCRLYPLLPLFDIDGRLTGVDPNFGIFEELESLDALPRACQLTTIPFGEMDKFLAITAAIGQDPTTVFYATAYHLTKAHARAQLAAAQASQGARQISGLALFEGLFALKRLLDQNVLRAQVEELAGRFRDRYGAAFRLAEPDAGRCD
ncbi:MAG: hypothetical protein JWN40_3027 [Phycisphaerales bacterium]|nr:hypothetical protein [Phycisphaerales bacterium]